MHAGMFLGVNVHRWPHIYCSSIKLIHLTKLVSWYCNKMYMLHIYLHKVFRQYKIQRYDMHNFKWYTTSYFLVLTLQQLNCKQLKYHKFQQPKVILIYSDNILNKNTLGYLYSCLTQNTTFWYKYSF